MPPSMFNAFEEMYLFWVCIFSERSLFGVIKRDAENMASHIPICQGPPLTYWWSFVCLIYAPSLLASYDVSPCSLCRRCLCFHWCRFFACAICFSYNFLLCICMVDFIRVIVVTTCVFTTHDVSSDCLIFDWSSRGFVGVGIQFSELRFYGRVC